MRWTCRHPASPALLKSMAGAGLSRIRHAHARLSPDAEAGDASEPGCRSKHSSRSRAGGDASLCGENRRNNHPCGAARHPYEYEQTVNATDGMTLALSRARAGFTCRRGTGWLLLNKRSRAEAVARLRRHHCSRRARQTQVSRAGVSCKGLDDHADRIISFVRARDLLIQRRIGEAA